MVLVRHQRSEQRLRGPGERPANHRRWRTRLAEDAPDRLRPQRGGGLRGLGQETDGHEAVREAVVRQQIEGRAGTRRRAVDRRRSHAVVRRKLPRRERRQHRRRLRRLQRRQVKGGPRVQNPLEVGQPAVSGRWSDEIERRAVDVEEHHASARAFTRRWRADRQAAPPERRREAGPAYAYRQRDRHQHQREHRDAARASAARSDRVAEDRHEHERQPARGHRRGADRHPPHGFVVERGVQPSQVEPHQRRRQHRRARAERPEQPHAEPAGRRHLRHKQLLCDDQRVEERGEVDAVARPDRRDEAPRGALKKRKRGIQL